MIIVTVDQLLEYAQRNRQADCPCPSCSAFGAIVDLLETPYPCGWPKPELTLVDAKQPGIAWEAIDGFMSAEEARAIGVALIRAADQVESAT